jgi:hypothetical protein
VVRFAAVLVTLGLLGLAGRARAEPRARLEYSRESASGCPEASGLESAVQARLGEDPFDPQGLRAFQVRLLARGEALIGLVTLLDAQGVPDGMRRFDGSQGHCDELISAIALAISIAINPELASSEAATPSAAPVAAPPPVAPVEPRAPPAKEPAPAAPLAATESAPSWVLAVGLEGHAALGAGPELTGGAGVLGRARRRALSLSLEGRFDAPVPHPVGEDFVDSRLLGGSLLACGHLGPGFGCAALLVADVQASSDGVDRSDTDNGLFIAAGPRVGAEVRLVAGMSLEARLDALFTVKPVAIVLNDSPVWESPGISGALGVALVWQLP